MELHAQGRSVPDEVGTYCSLGLGGGRCVDTAGPAGPTLRLAPGLTKLSFEWDWHADALEVGLCRGRLFRRCPHSSELDLGVSWTVELRPGEWMLAVFAKWEGGDASYQWFLDVRQHQ